MPFNTSYSNSILNFLFGGSNLTAPTEIYLGLSSNDPTDTGTFNEITGGNYERALIVSKKTGSDAYGIMSTASNRSITNKKQINWTKATTAWTTARGFGLFSSASGGTPFFYGALELTEEQQAAGGLNVPMGSIALIDPGALNVSMP